MKLIKAFLAMDVCSFKIYPTPEETYQNVENWSLIQEQCTL